MAEESNLVAPWEKGVTGNPRGRPLSGRTVALNVLDRLLKKAGNVKLMEDDLQLALEESPRKFFLTFVMPLLPKEAHPERQAQRLILSFATVPAKEEKVIEAEDVTKKGE